MTKPKPIELGAYIWDGAISKVGIVDKLGPANTVHYKEQQRPNSKPVSHWTAFEDVTVLTGPIADGKTTIMQRMVNDLVNNEPTFRMDDDGEIYWTDAGNYSYKIEPPAIPGISDEERKWH